jgi:hypothetical protein
VHKKLLNYGFFPTVYQPTLLEIARLDEKKIKNAQNTFNVKDISVFQERCKAAATRVIHMIAGQS